MKTTEWSTRIDAFAGEARLTDAELERLRSEWLDANGWPRSVVVGLKLDTEPTPERARELADACMRHFFLKPSDLMRIDCYRRRN